MQQKLTMNAGGYNSLFPERQTSEEPNGHCTKLGSFSLFIVSKCRGQRYISDIQYRDLHVSVLNGLQMDRFLTRLPVKNFCWVGQKSQLHDTAEQLLKLTYIKHNL